MTEDEVSHNILKRVEPVENNHHQPSRSPALLSPKGTNAPKNPERSTVDFLKSNPVQTVSQLLLLLLLSGCYLDSGDV